MNLLCFHLKIWKEKLSKTLTRMLYKWGWSCRILKERKSNHNMFYNRVIQTIVKYFFKWFILTWQTHWAHVTDFNEVPVAEACSSVIYVCGRWQHQLRALLRVRQKHPLFVNTKTKCFQNQNKICLELSELLPHSYQQVLCQGNFLWYLQVQAPSYITSLQNKHITATPRNKLSKNIFKGVLLCILSQSFIPVVEDLSLCPARRHRSGCSVFKYKNKVILFWTHGRRILKLKSSILPAFEQQKSHSWSSYTEGHSHLLL